MLSRKNNHIAITVIVMVYNHKKYISKALDSILSQKIDVPFDVLVHDDFSDDGTYEILLAYQKKYKDKIRLIRQNERKFPILGFNKMIYQYVVPELDCDYVAYCDGDDYWINDQKLQIQYDFLRNNFEFVMCCHNSLVECDGQLRNTKQFLSRNKQIRMHDILNCKPGICIATSTIFLKCYIFKSFPGWRMSFPVEDRPLYMYCAMIGKIFNFKQKMSVYRQFTSSSWSLLTKKNPEVKIKHFHQCIISTQDFNSSTNYKYDKFVQDYIDSCLFRIALREGDDKIIFNKKYKKNLRYLSLKKKILLKLKFKSPKLYSKIFAKRVS